MEHCVAGKEKYLASSSGLFGQSTRETLFDSKAAGVFSIVIARSRKTATKQSRPGVMTQKQSYYAYMMTNKINSVIYTGMTRNLVRRAYEHKNSLMKGFTKKYKVIKLVWYEQFEDAYSAISREKQIKGGSRRKKIDLIEAINANWEELVLVRYLNEVASSASGGLAMTIIGRIASALCLPAGQAGASQ